MIIRPMLPHSKSYLFLQYTCLVFITVHFIQIVHLIRSVAEHLRKSFWNNQKGRNETINETQMEVLTVHSDVLKQIWKPDLFFSNEKDAATHKIVTENALIRYKLHTNIFMQMFIDQNSLSKLKCIKSTRRWTNIYIYTINSGSSLSHVFKSLSNGCSSL